MSEPSPIVCQYRKATGRAFNDCVFLGRRFPEDVGPVSTECDFYILINEPGAGGTMTHAFWSFRSFVTGIWRAPAGTVYATDADLGGLYVFADIMDTDSRAERVKLNDITPEGVWGLSDDCVFVWGTRMNAQRQKSYPVFRYDGRAWHELPSLPHPANALHGVAEDLIYAVGWRGMVAQWTGSGWQEHVVPTHQIITDVHVESRDEIYAVTNDGVLLEGSASGWGLAGSNPLGATPFSSVAKFRGELYIGANSVGLMKRGASGAIEEFKPKVGAVHMEVRENLIITMEEKICGTSDGLGFKGAATNQLAALTAGKPITPL